MKKIGPKIFLAYEKSRFLSSNIFRRRSFQFFHLKIIYKVILLYCGLKVGKRGLLLRILKILGYLRFDQKLSKYWIFYNAFLFLRVALKWLDTNSHKNICTPLNIWKSIKINPEQIHRPRIQIWAQNHRCPSWIATQNPQK